MIFILTLIVIALAQIGGPWAVALLVAAAIAEVGEIILLRRWAKVTPCRPQGQVRVRGEIWEAGRRRERP